MKELASPQLPHALRPPLPLRPLCRRTDHTTAHQAVPDHPDLGVSGRTIGKPATQTIADVAQCEPWKEAFPFTCLLERAIEAHPGETLDEALPQLCHQRRPSAVRLRVYSTFPLTDFSSAPNAPVDSRPVDSRPVDSRPVLVCHHGAGFGALSFAALAKASRPLFHVVAFDCRGHGDTQPRSLDLGIAALIDDFIFVVVSVLKALKGLSLKAEVSPGQSPRNVPLVFCGHSMGGAVVAKAAQHLQTLVNDGVFLNGLARDVMPVAVILLDISEETAMHALKRCKEFARRRPRSFASVDDAITWAKASQMILDESSSRLSLPSQLEYVPESTCKTAAETDRMPLPPLPESLGCIEEVDLDASSVDTTRSDENYPMDEGSAAGASTAEASTAGGSWVWKNDLMSTEKYWTEWFTGMNEAFLSLSPLCHKMLVVGNVHFLDDKLLAAHMQGRFQMEALSCSGHAIHEDRPQSVRDLIASWYRRHAAQMALISASSTEKP